MWNIHGQHFCKHNYSQEINRLATKLFGIPILKNRVLDPVATPTIRCTGQTLYAQYVPITYTVEFQSGGGTGTMEKQMFQYGTAQNLNANQFEKSIMYLVVGKVPMEEHLMINNLYKT